MVYFVTNATASWHVDQGFLDTASENPFHDLPYAQPDKLELRAVETEHTYTIGHGYKVSVGDTVYKALWKEQAPDFRIPDIASMRGQQIVSQKFKALIERFETDIHQFIPIDIYRHPRGEPYARYYCMNVCNRVDSTDAKAMERNGWFWRPDYAGGRSHWRRQGQGKKPPLVFNLRQIAGRHLWVDTFLAPHMNFYASDAFVDAARAEGMTGMLVAHHAEI